MSDDSFIREVNEEVRKDQARALWERYGTWLISLVLAVILGTGAFVAYQYWSESRANRSGDAFSQALELANSGRGEEALEALARLEEDGYGAYPLLARMRASTVLVDQGDHQGAVAGLDVVAADASVPQLLRDVARVRAGLILVDHGTYADVAARVETLTGETHPLRHSARELLALSAWKAGRMSDALVLFDELTQDPEAPARLRQRAQLMSELIRGAGNGS